MSDKEQRNVLMPTDKESDCLTLNFYIMKNEQEMLDLFQVEELEKRYEMGWIKKTEVYIEGDNKGTIKGGAKITL